MKRLSSLLGKLGFLIGISLLLSIYFAPRFPVASASTAPQVLRGHTGAVSSIDVSHDGRLIATGSLDRTVRLWDAQTSKPAQTLQGHQAEVYAVAFSPNDRLLASSSYDGRVMLWDVKAGKLLRTLEIKGWSTAIAFSPDSRQLAVGSQERNIVIYDAQGGKVLRTFETRGSINTLAFSPDGRYLASANSSIALWNLQTGQIIKTLRGHQGSIMSISFSKDGHLLASASRDKTARLWNVETGESMKTFETLTPIAVSYAPQPIKRKMPVTAVAFSPDGKLLAMTTGRAVHVWNASTGDQIRILEGHTESITGAVFFPDGNSLASSSLDGTVRIWSLKSQ